MKRVGARKCCPSRRSNIKGRDKKQRRWQEKGGDAAWYHYNTETIVSLCWERSRKEEKSDT